MLGLKTNTGRLDNIVKNNNNNNHREFNGEIALRRYECVVYIVIVDVFIQYRKIRLQEVSRRNELWKK